MNLSLTFYPLLVCDAQLKESYIQTIKRHKILNVLLQTQSPGHQIDGTNRQTSLKKHLQTQSQGNHMAELGHHGQSRQMKNVNTAYKHMQSQNKARERLLSDTSSNMNADLIVLQYVMAQNGKMLDPYSSCLRETRPFRYTRTCLLVYLELAYDAQPDLHMSNTKHLITN